MAGDPQPRSAFAQARRAHPEGSSGPRHNVATQAAPRTPIGRRSATPAVGPRTRSRRHDETPSQPRGSTGHRALAPHGGVASTASRDALRATLADRRAQERPRRGGRRRPEAAGSAAPLTTAAVAVAAGEDRRGQRYCAGHLLGASSGRVAVGCRQPLGGRGRSRAQLKVPAALRSPLRGDELVDAQRAGDGDAAAGVEMPVAVPGELTPDGDGQPHAWLAVDGEAELADDTVGRCPCGPGRR